MHGFDRANAWMRPLGYRIARTLGLDVGIDWARGPDDNAYYLQVGTAWR